MLIIGFASFVLFVHGVVALRYIEVNNRNDYPIWIQTQGNNGHPALLNGQIMKFDAGASFKYDIEEDGWSGRLWPKTECQPNGQNCEFGQSVPSCPTEGGCHWPAETRVEFFFPPNGDLKAAYYNISLMDGYSLGAEIIPYSNVSSVFKCVKLKPRRKQRIKVVFYSTWADGRKIHWNWAHAFVPFVM